MSTVIRPEISKKNQYWISRHRFYELKHFCLQYHDWKSSAELMLECRKHSPWNPNFVKHTGLSDPVYQCVMLREEFMERMDMVEKAAKAAAPDLWPYLLKAVTEGISYEHLVAQMEIPCCKETYYEAFRRFFWAISKLRK